MYHSKNDAMRQIMVYIFREACFDSRFESFLIFTDFRKKGVVSWGGTLRFMYYQPDGMAYYWIQGLLTDRLDKYRVARTSNFVKNCFKVEQVKVITCWGVRGMIPEKFIVNLSHNTEWSLVTDRLLTTKRDEAITCRENEVHETFDGTNGTIETSANNETESLNISVTKQNMNEISSEYSSGSNVEDETDDRETHLCAKNLEEEACLDEKGKQLESGPTPEDFLWALKSGSTKEWKSSHKEEESEDVVKSINRIPEKDLSERNKSRNHGIILPRLIESDEENKTEDEEENLNEKLKYDKDSKSEPQC